MMSAKNTNWPTQLTNFSEIIRNWLTPFPLFHKAYFVTLKILKLNRTFTRKV